MTDNKQKIDVYVGEPVEVPSRFSSGVGRTIDITKRVSLYPTTSLKSLISELTAMQRKYGDRYEDMHFASVHDCGCYSNDCGCSPSYYLKGKRYETDIEQKLRLDEAAKRAEDQKARDERELAAIAKRLGKTVV